MNVVAWVTVERRSNGWALVNESGTVHSGIKTKRDAITLATNVLGYTVVK